MSKIRRYIDIGANLTDLMYTGVYNGSKKHEADLEQVLKRSWETGLEKIIITGGNLEESNKALELANSSGKLYCTVGCHPTRCSEFENNPSEYLNNLRKVAEIAPKKIVAIGECGLDYDRLNFCPKEVQKKYFELQLELSKTLDLPLFLHCRNAADDLYEILKNYPNIKGVVHSFDGKTHEAERFIKMGLHIGINGCSLKTKENLEMVATLPNDKILLETDCPWCEIRPSHAGYSLISSPQQYPSIKKEKWKPDHMVKSRNEPNNIAQVLDVISSVKNADPFELSETIYENTIKLFFS